MVKQETHEALGEVEQGEEDEEQQQRRQHLHHRAPVELRVEVVLLFGHWSLIGETRVSKW